MKTFKRTAIITLIVVAVILITAFFFVHRVARKGLPDYNQQISLPGL